MSAHDIWSIAGAILASVGGAGIIICAVSGFISERLAKRIDAKYEHRLNKELERYRTTLDERRHITKAQFDREFEIYHKLSKSFFSMIVKLSSFTEGTLELKELPKDNKTVKLDEFIRMVKTTSEAQDTLYENAAFLPKAVFEQYDAIYNKANDLFWLYESRMRDFAFGKIECSELVSEKDKATVKEIEQDFSLVNSALRYYLATLSIVE